MIEIKWLSIVTCCLWACSSAFGAPIHAVGPSELPLPSSLKAAEIDAVAAERNGRNVPVDFQVTGGALLITPCNDFEGGAAYTIKLFTKTGERRLIEIQVEPFPTIDTARNTVIKVPAKPSKGFNYAYFLRVPANAGQMKDQRLLVQCDNTVPSDKRPYLEYCAEKEVTSGFAQVYSRELQTPCLVPAFPRDDNYRSPDYAYMQFLDRGALIAKGQRQRVDLQLVAMIRDAREGLLLNGIKVDEKVFMTGFSADGKFCQRFTIMHPELVMAAFAGGIAGITTYPLSEHKGEKLRYPIGVADLKELTGRDFNKEEYDRVPQFFCMGELENTDATEYGDCYPKKDSEQIWRLFGRRQMPDRWAATQKVLSAAAPNIRCKTYPGIGHEITTDVKKDVVQFFREHWSR